MPAGDCFFGRYPGIKEPHLHIQVSGISGDGQVSIVNASTFRALSDPTCILNPEDHKRIVHKSFIMYAGAKLISVAQIQLLVEAGLWVVDPALAPAVLARVVAGVANSDDSPESIISFVQKHP